jgi:hypothetical protein
MVEDWSTTSDSVSPKDPAGLTRTWLKMSGYADTGREASRSDFLGNAPCWDPNRDGNGVNPTTRVVKLWT